MGASNAGIAGDAVKWIVLCVVLGMFAVAGIGFYVGMLYERHRGTKSLLTPEEWGAWHHETTSK